MISDRRAWRARNLPESEASAFWERYDSSDDWSREIKTVRDVQTLFSFGIEFSASYNGINAFLCPCNGYAIDAKNVETGETYEYVADDLDEFGRDAKFGPYPLADVIGRWKIGWHA